MISRVLSNRNKKVIGLVIAEDQTAYFPGRSIRESIRLISDLQEYADTHNLPGYMTTADIEKSFDSTERSFLIAVLKSAVLAQTLSVGTKPYFTNRKAR